MTEPRQHGVDRLRRLWQEGRGPDLVAFLAETGPLKPSELAEVICEDQRQRWRIGQRLPAERYLAAHPAVAADDDAALDVIYTEFLLRKEAGEAVDREAFLSRFPGYAEQLRLQLEFGEALAAPVAPPPAAPPQRPPTAGAASPDPTATEPGFPNAPDGHAPMAAPRTPLPADGAAARPTEARTRIEDRCNSFEAAWVKGPQPHIEDYLAGAAAPLRAALLHELVPLDAAYRRANGEASSPGEYQTRFPELEATWLAAAVAAPPANAKSGAPTPGPLFRRPRAHRIRCPHCHSPIQLVDERPHEVLCPGCGSSFRLQEAHGTTSAPSLRLGKFQLLDRVGRGAFGAVWRALDAELDRVVALKIPHAGLAISPIELKHFLDEARKAAKLRHPGIVKVHEVTTLQGLPVIVSDFIQGVTLKDLMEVRRPNCRETARLIAEVADALDHAHANGLIHRDVKPANIMVERDRREAGAPTADDLGRPLVLDFGLALREEAQITMTVEGEIIGTPAYINPEQAAGRGHHADRRSDVFSLGVVLYEMLCGELPFRGSRLMLLDQVQRDDPRAPRRINERIPRDLETICLKAMAKLPAKRYQTAAELAADLRRFLQGEPIHARRAGRMERLWRWCRRRPRDAALAGALLGMLLLLAVGSTVAAIWIEREREATEAQRRRAEEHLTETSEVVDLMTAVAEEVVEDTPQMEDRQQQLLEKALECRKQLVKERPTAAGERLKQARAYCQMGRILGKLRHSAQTNQDLMPEAEQDFTRAIEVFRQLEAEDPNTAEYPEGEAVALDERALLLSNTSHGDAVDADYQASRAILERLRDGPTKPPPQVLQDLALTCNNYGIFLMNNIQPKTETVGRFRIEPKPGSGPEGKTKADKLYGEAEELLTELLLREDPEHQDAYAADLARVLDNRGILDGDDEKALGEYDRAIDLLQDLTVRHPTKNEFRLRLALVRLNKGDALKGLKRFPEAETCHLKAVELFKRLTADFPKYPDYHRGLANAFNSLGVDLKNTPALLGAGLLGSAPGPGPLLVASAVTAGRLRQLDDARSQFESAKEHFNEVLQDDPNNPEVQSLAGLTHHNLGRVYQECNQLGNALAELEHAIDLQQKAHELNRDNLAYVNALGSHYQSHASVHVLCGDYAGAAKDAARIEQLVPATEPNVFKEACIYAKCAAAADRTSKTHEAEHYAETAVHLLRELHDANYERLNLEDNDLTPLRGRDDFRELGDLRRKERQP